MKKRIFVPLAVALLLGLAACSGGGDPSSATDPGTSATAEPTSTSSGEAVYNSVTISNKETLEEPWYLGTGTRSMTVTCDPVTNATQAFIDGILVSTSSNPAVVSVSNTSLTALAVGTATITVTYGGQVSDSVDITVTEVTIDQISGITEADVDTAKRVQGQVTYTDSKEIVVDDGTGAILVFGATSSDYEVDDYIDVSGTISNYHDTLQFASGAQVTKIDPIDITPTINSLDVLDPETVDAKYGTGAVTTLKPVSFWGTAFTTSTGYKAFYVQDVDTTILIEPTNWAGEWQDGAIYDVEGYIGAWYDGYSYAPLYITHLANHPIEMTSFTLAAEGGEATVFIEGTLQLNVVPTPENATELDVTWASSDATVATVDEGGLVTGIKTGNVTITATHEIEGADPLTASITLEVIPAVDVTGITLNQTTVTGIHGAKTATLTATVAPAEAWQAVTWTSEDATIATVDENGVVTGVAAGTTTITATTKGTDASGNALTATCSVTVEGIPVGTAENPLDAEVWGTWVSEDASSSEIKNYNDETYIRGTVRTASYSSGYGNYTIYLESASGLTLEFFRAVVAEGATGVTAGDDLNNKILVCKGTTVSYYGTVELAQGCEIVSAEDAPVPAGEETLTFSSVFSEATTLVTQDSPTYTIDAAETFNFTITKVDSSASNNSNYNTSGHLRIYSGDTFTISAKEAGKTITGIEINFDGSTRGFSSSSTVDSGTIGGADTATGTWTPGETAVSSVTFDPGRQVRPISVVVTIA